MRLSPDVIATLGSKSRINKIGEMLIEPSPGRDVLDGVRHYRMFRVAYLGECIDRVMAASPPSHSLVCARLKRLVTIRRKLHRSKSRKIPLKLSRIDDIIGIRVICDHYNEALALSDRLSGQGSVVKDYVASPQETGYRAIHHILRVDQALPTERSSPMQFTFEVQVRTHFQNQWGIWSESFGEHAKENRASEEIRSRLIRLSKIIGEWEESHKNSRQDDLPRLSFAKEYGLALVGNAHGGKLEYFVRDSRRWKNVLGELFKWEKGDPRGADAVLLAGFGGGSDLIELLKISHPTRLVSTIRVPIDIVANSNLRFVFPPEGTIASPP